jgi:hypothetical protein
MTFSKYLRLAGNRTAIIERTDFLPVEFDVELRINGESYSGAFHYSHENARKCADAWVNDGEIILDGEF